MVQAEQVKSSLFPFDVPFHIPFRRSIPFHVPRFIPTPCVIILTVSAELLVTDGATSGKMTYQTSYDMERYTRHQEWRTSE